MVCRDGKSMVIAGNSPLRVTGPACCNPEMSRWVIEFKSPRTRPSGRVTTWPALSVVSSGLLLTIRSVNCVTPVRSRLSTAVPYTWNLPPTVSSSGSVRDSRAAQYVMWKSSPTFTSDERRSSGRGPAWVISNPPPTCDRFDRSRWASSTASRWKLAPTCCSDGISTNSSESFEYPNWKSPPVETRLGNETECSIGLCSVQPPYTRPPTSFNTPKLASSNASLSCRSRSPSTRVSRGSSAVINASASSMARSPST